MFMLCIICVFEARCEYKTMLLLKWDMDAGIPADWCLVWVSKVMALCHGALHSQGPVSLGGTLIVRTHL